MSPNLRTFTTLKAGGNPDRLWFARSVSELEDQVLECQNLQEPLTLLGWGSNVLPSDYGVPGTVIINLTSGIQVLEQDANGATLRVDSGVGFQNIFLFAAQRGLGGLEFAVGIPGTLGGALVSNAGAYRSDISQFVTQVKVIKGGQTRWESPDWMEFSYRDSVLRRPDPITAVVSQIDLRLNRRPSIEIYDDARDFQRQRIGKQPPSASAGSFFKNVVNQALAQEIPGLTDGMLKNGVIPAGFLIEHCGLKGYRIGGAMIGKRHANFLLNVGGATATELRSVAWVAKSRVKKAFGVELEEEVLYLGDWKPFQPLVTEPLE